jgi:hypothetical protein
MIQALYNLPKSYDFVGTRDCPVWVELNGRVVCDPEDLDLVSVHGTSPVLFPNEFCVGKAVNSIHALLLGDILSPEFLSMLIALETLQTTWVVFNN